MLDEDAAPSNIASLLCLEKKTYYSIFVRITQQLPAPLCQRKKLSFYQAYPSKQWSAGTNYILSLESCSTLLSPLKQQFRLRTNTFVFEPILLKAGAFSFPSLGLRWDLAGGLWHFGPSGSWLNKPTPLTPNKEYRL